MLTPLSFPCADTQNNRATCERRHCPEALTHYLQASPEVVPVLQLLTLHKPERVLPLCDVGDSLSKRQNPTFVRQCVPVQDAGSGLLGTIEDFMWYKLALVRPAPQDRQDGPSTSGYFSGGYTLCPSLNIAAGEVSTWSVIFLVTHGGFAGSLLCNKP